MCHVLQVCTQTSLSCCLHKNRNPEDMYPYIPYFTNYPVIHTHKCMLKNSNCERVCMCVDMHIQYNSKAQTCKTSGSKEYKWRFFFRWHIQQCAVVTLRSGNQSISSFVYLSRVGVLHSSCLQLSFHARFASPLYNGQQCVPSWKVPRGLAGSF